MSLRTPTSSIRTLPRKLCPAAKGQLIRCTRRPCRRPLLRQHTSVSARSVARGVKPVGKPDGGNPHVRSDERGGETEPCQHVPSHRALDCPAGWLLWCNQLQ